jgi:integrative and conjugative element protein (TIGR02256 family)
VPCLFVAVIWQNPLDGSSKLLIEDSVLQLIKAERQLAPTAPEAGGILLGYRRNAHLHVTGATTPQPGDTRSRTRFDRRDERHGMAAIAAWRKSGETMDYLGEWHTHPERLPEPSSLDRSEWRKICARASTPMIFAICGYDGAMWVGVGARENECERASRISFEPSDRSDADADETATSG